MSEKQQSKQKGQRRRGRRLSRHQSRYFSAAHGEDHGGASIPMQLLDETTRRQIFTLQPMEDPTLEQLDIS